MPLHEVFSMGVVKIGANTINCQCKQLHME